MKLEELKVPTNNEEVQELEKILLTLSRLLGIYYNQKEFDFKADVAKMPTFKERLRALREHNNWTKTELARLCKISVKSITRYEKGEREPGLKILCTFAYWFKVKVDTLLGITRRQKDER